MSHKTNDEDEIPFIPRKVHQMWRMKEDFKGRRALSLEKIGWTEFKRTGELNFKKFCKIVK